MAPGVRGMSFEAPVVEILCFPRSHSDLWAKMLRDRC